MVVHPLQNNHLSWIIEMGMYLFSGWGFSTLLLLLVGGYFLGCYSTNRRAGKRHWRDLFWGVILTTWGLFITVLTPHYAWDAMAMYSGIVAGIVGIGKLIWDGSRVVFGARERTKRDFVASGALILTGVTNVLLFASSIAMSSR